MQREKGRDVFLRKQRWNSHCRTVLYECDAGHDEVPEAQQSSRRMQDEPPSVGASVGASEADRRRLGAAVGVAVAGVAGVGVAVGVAVGAGLAGLGGRIPNC